MKVYFYDKETFKYAGSREAVLDVLESQKEGKDIYALPANATFVEPPETNFLHALRFPPDFLLVPVFQQTIKLKSL